jgi:hypothetical protein
MPHVFCPSRAVVDLVRVYFYTSPLFVARGLSPYLCRDTRASAAPADIKLVPSLYHDSVLVNLIILRSSRYNACIRVLAQSD